MRVDARSEFRPRSKVRSKCSIQCPSLWQGQSQTQVPWHSLLYHKLDLALSAKQDLSQAKWNCKKELVSLTEGLHRSGEAKAMHGDNKGKGKARNSSQRTSRTSSLSRSNTIWRQAAGNQKKIAFLLLSPLLASPTLQVRSSELC